MGLILGQITVVSHKGYHVCFSERTEDLTEITEEAVRGSHGVAISSEILQNRKFDMSRNNKASALLAVAHMGLDLRFNFCNRQENNEGQRGVKEVSTKASTREVTEKHGGTGFCSRGASDHYYASIHLACTWCFCQLAFSLSSRKLSCHCQGRSIS